MKQMIRLYGELPPPLETNRENEAINALKNECDTEARLLLIEHDLRLAAYVANQFSNTGVDVNELFSVGVIGLIKGIDAFNLEKGTSLATFVRSCIENEILMHLKRSRRSRSETSLNELLCVDEEGKELSLDRLTLGGLLSTDGSEIFRNIELEVDRQLATKALGILNGREKTIIEMHFGFGSFGGQTMTQSKVADALGLSQSYVSRLEKRALRRMRRYLERISMPDQACSLRANYT